MAAARAWRFRRRTLSWHQARLRAVRAPPSVPAITAVRHIAFLRDRLPPSRETETAKMKARLDTPVGRAQYGRRFATVEPVFASLRHNKRLDRCTPRGRAKVDARWKLYCLVHNIEHWLTRDTPREECARYRTTTRTPAQNARHEPSRVATRRRRRVQRSAHGFHHRPPHLCSRHRIQSSPVGRFGHTRNRTLRTI